MGGSDQWGNITAGSEAYQEKIQGERRMRLPVRSLQNQTVPNSVKPKKETFGSTLQKHLHIILPVLAQCIR
jgi:tyrosyl-tRNA synthetase